MTLSLSRRRLMALAAASLLATAAQAQDTRIFESNFGPVEIPVKPLRVVTTHYIATQPLVDLGLLPVGQGPIDPSYVIPEHYALLSAIPVVTQESGEPNYEQIVGLAPDLIFDHNGASEDRIARLRQIAPVVQIGIRGPDRALWQSRAQQIADVTGLLDKWTELEATLATRQADIASRYGAVLADNPVVIFGAWADRINVFTSNTMTGRVIGPAGAIFAPAAEALANADGTDVLISAETIGSALGDAAIVLYNVTADGVSSPSADIRALPVYQRVPAVAAGRQYPIGQITISGYGDAHHTLDLFEAALAAVAK